MTNFRSVENVISEMNPPSKEGKSKSLLDKHFSILANELYSAMVYNGMTHTENKKCIEKFTKSVFIKAYCLYMNYLITSFSTTYCNDTFLRFLNFTKKHLPLLEGPGGYVIATHYEQNLHHPELSMNIFSFDEDE